MKHLRNLGLMATLFALTGVAHANPGNRLGFNTSGLAQIAVSNPFIDKFKVARGWITSCEYDWQNNRPIDPGCTKKNSFNTGETDKVKVDRFGWPMRLPSRGEAPIYTSINAIWDLGEFFTLGEYVVTYAGDADMTVHGDLTVTHQQPGRIEFTLNSTKRNLRLHITRINPRHYIRNIKVIPKRYVRVANQQKFNPDYLNTIRPFNAIRFMPWQNTKDTKFTRWEQRTTPNHAFYNGNAGMPIETMVELANQVNAAPWFSMPHLADNTLLYRFAQLVKQKLKPGLKVYVENSNEIWNYMYPATHHATREGLKRWPNAYSRLNQGSRNLKLALNYNALRTTQICDIWKRVWGNQKHRVVCVLSAYAGSPKMGEEALSCPLAGGNCASKIDAYAVAPYFGDYIARIENRNILRGWAHAGAAGMNNLFSEIYNGNFIDDKIPGGAIPRAIKNRIAPNVALARKYGVQLLAYEGGQHLLRVDGAHRIYDEKIFELFAKANQDPRMVRAYQQYLHAWRNNGGGMIMHFNGISNIDNHNYFAMLERPERPNSPKYNALINFLRGR